MSIRSVNYCIRSINIIVIKFLIRILFSYTVILYQYCTSEAKMSRKNIRCRGWISFTEIPIFIYMKFNFVFFLLGMDDVILSENTTFNPGCNSTVSSTPQLQSTSRKRPADDPPQSPVSSLKVKFRKTAPDSWLPEVK